MPIILSKKAGGGGGAPSGPAGGDLSGTYPNPTVNRTAIGLDPVAEVFGTPNTAFEFQSSSLAGLTALGSPDAQDADTTVPDHYYIRDDNATNSLVGRYLASPATPFTAITKAAMNVRTSPSEAFAGPFVGAATPGALLVVCRDWSGGTTRTDSWLQWTNPTTFNTGGGVGVQWPIGTVYFAIVAHSNTDVDLMVSHDGYIWVPIVLARNPGFTIGSVGMCINAGNTVTAAAFDYLRIWNSAKVFPGIVT